VRRLAVFVLLAIVILGLVAAIVGMIQGGGAEAAAVGIRPSVSSPSAGRCTNSAPTRTDTCLFDAMLDHRG
jgi:hypothetical protein